MNDMAGGSNRAPAESRVTTLKVELETLTRYPAPVFEESAICSDGALLKAVDHVNVKSPIEFRTTVRGLRDQRRSSGDQHEEGGSNGRATGPTHAFLLFGSVPVRQTAPVAMNVKAVTSSATPVGETTWKVTWSPKRFMR